MDGEQQSGQDSAIWRQQGKHSAVTTGSKSLHPAQQGMWSDDDIIVYDNRVFWTVKWRAGCWSEMSRSLPDHSPIALVVFESVFRMCFLRGPHSARRRATRTSTMSSLCKYSTRNGIIYSRTLLWNSELIGAMMPVELVMWHERTNTQMRAMNLVSYVRAYQRFILESLKLNIVM